MRTHFQRPASVPMWIAGVSIGLFAALGIAAIAPPIPASYDAILDGNPPSTPGAAAGLAGSARLGSPEAQVDAARAAAGARGRVRCPECGVVESIRQIERSGATGEHVAGDKLVARGASDSAVAADGTAGNGYEITIRLRDGSRTVFNEASPRTWRPGSRVLVIGRAVAAKD